MTDQRIETYQMGQGVYFDDRVDDFEGVLVEHFEGVVSGQTTVEVDGVPTDCYIVEDVEVDGLNRVIAGRVSPPTKKDRLGVRFVETHPRELEADADPSEAIEAKNEFLHAVTGRTAEDRRRSWENAVEDESPDV